MVKKEIKSTKLTNKIKNGWTNPQEKMVKIKPLNRQEHTKKLTFTKRKEEREK